MKFTTETGSIYTLDKGTMGWSRVGTVESGVIRREFGTLLEWPAIELGKPALLWDSTVKEGCDLHYVVTSPVISIEAE